jgi:hypothetical protein
VIARLIAALAVGARAFVVGSVRGLSVGLRPGRRLLALALVALPLPETQALGLLQLALIVGLLLCCASAAIERALPRLSDDVRVHLGPQVAAHFSRLLADPHRGGRFFGLALALSLLWVLERPWHERPHAWVAGLPGIGRAWSAPAASHPPTLLGRAGDRLWRTASRAWRSAPTPQQVAPVNRSVSYALRPFTLRSAPLNNARTLGRVWPPTAVQVLGWVGHDDGAPSQGTRVYAVHPGAPGAGDDAVWLKLRADDRIGWAWADGVALGRRQAHVTVQLRAGRAYARVRSAPTTSAGIVTMLGPGIRRAFVRVSPNGRWVEIPIAPGRTGWVARSLVHEEVRGE